MLRKRVIFALIYDNDQFVQSRNFRHQRVGGLGWLENNYRFRQIAYSIDELIVLDATREGRNIEKFARCVNKLSESVFIPLSAGGGIRRMEDAEVLFRNGADKMVLNTVLYTDRNLVADLSYRYGVQSIVASVDYRNVGGERRVFVKNGQEEVPMPLNEYMDMVCEQKIGEVYLNSIDRDGTGFGYDMETVLPVSETLNVPLIVAGGAGNADHLISAISEDKVNAVATANLFNFVGDGLPSARTSMIERGINLAQWGEYTKV